MSMDNVSEPWLSLMREFEVHAESASFQTHAEFLADKPYDI
jgi:hypothetical protein